MIDGLIYLVGQGDGVGLFGIGFGQGFGGVDQFCYVQYIDSLWCNQVFVMNFFDIQYSYVEIVNDLENDLDFDN